MSMDKLRSMHVLQEHLYLILPLFLSVLVFLALLAFVLTAVLPQVRARVAAEHKLELVQGRLERLRMTQQQGPERVHSQIAAAQHQVQVLGRQLLTGPQVGTILNTIYKKADTNGIVITDVQAQPGAKPAPGTSYEMRAFRISARGSMEELLSFLGDISTLTGESVQFNNLNLESSTLDGSETQLAVDVIMYIFVPSQIPAR